MDMTQATISIDPVGIVPCRLDQLDRLILRPVSFVSHRSLEWVDRPVKQMNKFIAFSYATKFQIFL
jgi:hypothetical protein